MPAKPEYLKRLETMKRELRIVDNQQLCDMLINAEKYYEKYGELAQPASEDSEDYYSLFRHLHKAVIHAFNERGLITPSDQAEFAHKIGMTETYTSKIIYPTLRHLRLVNSEGENFRLAPKAWKSVMK